MNKILITGDTEDIANITISDDKFIQVIYHNGRQVKYLYNPHFDFDEFGKSEWEKEHEQKQEQSYH